MTQNNEIPFDRLRKVVNKNVRAGLGWNGELQLIPFLGKNDNKKGLNKATKTFSFTTLVIAVYVSELIYIKLAFFLKS